MVCATKISSIEVSRDDSSGGRTLVVRKQKIALGEMRAMGVHGLLVYCSDYHCSHWTTINADRWPDDVRLSDIEHRFTCQACGAKRADLRPNLEVGGAHDERLGSSSSRNVQRNCGTRNTPGTLRPAWSLSDP